MEKRLFCGVMLSLEEIALRNVTVNLWNESILDPSQKYENRWNVIEDMVRGKVNELQCLAGRFKRPILHLVKPIGLDILKWIQYHEYNNFFDRSKFDMRILLQLRRTWAVAIDYQKTAEEFVRLKKFVVWDNFRLASLFCLEDKIPLLWGELSEDSKTYIYEHYAEEFHILNDTRILNYWCSVMREDERNLERILEKHQLSKPSFYKQSLKISALKGNKAATEYFFRKLAGEEGNLLPRTVDYLMETRFPNLLKVRDDFPDEQVSDVLKYLLSLMTPDQQMQVFETYPFQVLIYFLKWPSEYLFVDITQLFWRFLSEYAYGALLTCIYKCISKPGCYYPNSFQEFFLRSPSSFKKIFVDDECRSGFFLEEFFLAQDADTVRVIFRNIDAGDRVKLVFSEPVFKLFNDFLIRGRWNIVEECIREATLSKEDRVKLKGEFLEYVTRTDKGKSVKWRTHKRRRFFEFLDEMDTCSAERDETPAKVKKSCGDGERNVPPGN